VVTWQHQAEPTSQDDTRGQAGLVSRLELERGLWTAAIHPRRPLGSDQPRPVRAAVQRVQRPGPGRLRDDRPPPTPATGSAHPSPRV